MRNKKRGLRLTTRPIYHFWQALYLSFFSPNLYKDVYKRWCGYGFLYLFFLIFCITIPFSLRIIIDFGRYFDEKIALPIKKLPTLYIQKGKVHLDKPMPYRIKNDKGEVVAIIDTTGKTKEFNTKLSSLSLLITKDKIFYRPPEFNLFFDSLSTSSLIENRIKEQSLIPEDNEVFVGEDWFKDSGAYQLKILVQALMFPLVVVFFYALYFVFIITLAMLGQVFVQIFFNFMLTYKESCRMLCVSITPHLVVFLTILTSTKVFPGLGFYLIALLAVYFYLAVIAIKKNPKNMVPS